MAQAKSLSLPDVLGDSEEGQGKGKPVFLLPQDPDPIPVERIVELGALKIFGVPHENRDRDLRFEFQGQVDRFQDSTQGSPKLVRNEREEGGRTEETSPPRSLPKQLSDGKSKPPLQKIFGPRALMENVLGLDHWKRNTLLDDRLDLPSRRIHIDYRTR